MIIKSREIHWGISVSASYYKLFILLIYFYESWFKVFWFVNLKVFSTFVFYAFFIYIYIYSNVLPLPLSFGVYSRLYPGSWIENTGVLFSLIQDSEIPKKSKLSLLSLRMVENSSKWWGREEIFKWKNYKLEVCLFVRDDVSLGLKDLLTTRSLFVSSVAEFSLSIRLWSLGRGFVIALNLNFFTLISFK